MVGGRLVIEASGGITLDTVAEIAATGVDYVSAGALTHSAPALDVGLGYRDLIYVTFPFGAHERMVWHVAGIAPLARGR